MARLVVVGLPGVGKSSVAVALGARWGCTSVDTDDVLAARVGVPAASYLREHGEPAFRDLELEVLRECLDRDAVVATGAGVVVSTEGRERLAEETTLWLDCDDEVLLTRLEEGDRPLLGDDHAAALRTLRATRAPWYREVARATVDASGTVADVTDRVLECWERVTS